MARKPKNDWLGGRVDEDLKEQVEAYLDEAQLTMGELIRASVKEFMEKHPIKEEE